MHEVLLPAPLVMVWVDMAACFPASHFSAISLTRFSLTAGIMRIPAAFIDSMTSTGTFGPV